MVIGMRFAICLLLVAACGDDDGVADGAPPVDGGTATIAEAPNIPWLEGGDPVEWSCDDAERAVPTGGCDPYPEDGPTECALGEAHFPGEAGCAAVGDPCPSGPFADDLPSDAPLIYVDAAATAGGDGSLATPYAALSEVGWTSLAPGSVVALAGGSYEGAISLRPGVELVGACAAETVLTGLSAPVPGVVMTTGAGEPAVLRNLRIASPPQVGIRVESGALTVDGVVVDDAVGAGLYVDGAGVTVEVRSSVFAAGRSIDGDLGFGILVSEGSVDASRAFFDGNLEGGVYVSGDGAEVHLADVAIEDVRPREADGLSGRGVTVDGGGRVEADGLWIVRAHEAGFLAGGEGTEAILADVVIRETQVRPGDELLGHGLRVNAGAHVEASRLLAIGNHEAAVAVVDAGAELRLMDAILAESLPHPVSMDYGHGVQVLRGARMEGSRLVIADNTQVGVFVSGTGTEALFSDVVVRDTQPSANDGHLGNGVTVIQNAHFMGERLLVSDNHEVGLVVGVDEARADLTDVLIRRTRVREADEQGGYGITAARSGVIEGVRVSVEDSASLGILTALGGTASFQDVSVVRVERSCSTEPGASCPLPAGYGAATTSTLRLERFVIRDAVTCGVMVASEGIAPSLDLTDGLVTGSAIGACVQVEGYDLGRLMSGVRYEDNDTNLDSTSLPVPQPVGLDGL
jgi:hypothetical protein